MNTRDRGYSLLEVIVAVGVFAVGLTGVLALLAPTTRDAALLVDADGASRWGARLQSDLQRLREELPGDRLAQLRWLATEAEAGRLTLVADRRLQRVHLQTGAVERGLPERDQFFRASIAPLDGPLAPDPSRGFLVVSVRIHWPYRQPTALGGADYQETESAERYVWLGTVALLP